MRRLPPLNALRAFEAASRHQSFTAAAGELGVSHAAVGRHVRALEATLGLSLFRRDGRGIALTEPGARLAAVATEALDRIAEGAAALAEEAGAGLLRVSVEPAFAARWLVPNLGGFRRSHPRVEIELDPSPRLADL